MANIKCKGNKEIDLLAVKLQDGEKFHVESRVSTAFKLRLKATYTKSGKCHKNGVDYFQEKKFEHSYIKEKVQRLFGKEDYTKILVVWDVLDYNIIKQAKEQYDIEIWFIDILISQLQMLSDMGLFKGSRDDVLRTLELITAKYKVVNKRLASEKFKIMKEFYSKHHPKYPLALYYTKKGVEIAV